MKKISKPDLTGARKLSALELNAIHFANDRTVISPAEMEQSAQAARKGAVG